MNHPFLGRWIPHKMTMKDLQLEKQLMINKTTAMSFTFYILATQSF